MGDVSSRAQKKRNARHDQVRRHQEVRPPRPPWELATVVDGLYAVYAHALGSECARSYVEPGTLEGLSEPCPSCRCCHGRFSREGREGKREAEGTGEPDSEGARVSVRVRKEVV